MRVEDTIPLVTVGHYSLSDTIPLVRVEDTIPLGRVEKLFFWLRSRGHVGGLG